MLLSRRRRSRCPTGRVGSRCWCSGGSAVPRSARPVFGTASPPGSHLSLASLPAGNGFGDPPAVRDVALHAQLGLPVVRRQVSVADFLASPTTDVDLAAASTLAHKLGVKLVVQIGQGQPAETAAVANGSWGAIVRRIVAANPTVPYWEAWNEPNTPMFFSGTAA